MAWNRDADMATRPVPEFLVERVLPLGSAAALVSAPGTGKTFLALDLAFAVASGNAWHGFTVQQSPVVYILAEGVGGMPARVAAWRQSRGVKPGVNVGVWFWDRDVQLANFPNRSAFLHELDKVRDATGVPKFIVVDTLARCFVGLDENAVQDMGKFVEGVDLLRSSGATVLVLHHEGHRKGRERGSTALRGAVDTMLYLAPTAPGEIMLTCTKQRDAEPFAPIYMKLRPVSLATGDDSCVIEVANNLPAPWLDAVAILHGEPDGMKVTDWMAACGLSKSVFYRMKKATEAAKLVFESKDGRVRPVKKEKA